MKYINLNWNNNSKINNNIFCMVKHANEQNKKYYVKGDIYNLKIQGMYMRKVKLIDIVEGKLKDNRGLLMLSYGDEYENVMKFLEKYYKKNELFMDNFLFLFFMKYKERIAEENEKTEFITVGDVKGYDEETGELKE